MKFISFDIASNSGYAVWENKKLLAYNNIPLKKSDEGAKLTNFEIKITELLHRVKPAFILCEELNYFRNAKTTRLLAGLRAILQLVYFVYSGNEVIFYPYVTVKKYIKEYFNLKIKVDKAIVNIMMTKHFNLPKVSEDITDAIALGFYFNENFYESIKK